MDESEEVVREEVREEAEDEGDDGQREGESGGCLHEASFTLMGEGGMEGVFSGVHGALEIENYL